MKSDYGSRGIAFIKASKVPVKSDKPVNTAPSKPSQPLANGYYTIYTALSSGKALDIKSGNTADGANLQVWDNFNNGQQRFYLKKLSNGYYTIQAFHSGKMLDVAGGKTASGTNVQQYASNGSNAQQWQIIKNSDGTYSIKSRLGTYLDCQNGTAGNGNNVWVYSQNGSKAQKWKFTKRSGSVFLALKETSRDSRPADYGLTVKVTGSCSVKSSAGWIHSCYYKSPYVRFSADENFGSARTGKVTVTCGDTSQTLTFNQGAYQPPIADGTYKIATKLSPNQVLDVKSRSLENRANIQLWKYGAAKNQEFEVTYIGGGYYKMINANSGKSLDVTGKGTAPKTNLQQYTYNGNPAQLWRLEHISNSSNNTFYLKSKLGTYIDCQSGKYANGTNVWMYKYNGSDAQKWIFTKVA